MPTVWKCSCRFFGEPNSEEALLKQLSGKRIKDSMTPERSAGTFLKLRAFHAKVPGAQGSPKKADVTRILSYPGVLVSRCGFQAMLDALSVLPKVRGEQVFS